MNKSGNKNALVLFAKAPIAGEVKTRLQPEITPENSARLREALIKDSIFMMSKISDVKRFIYFLPEEKKYMFEKFTDDLPFHLNCQNGVDLGEKMANAFHDLFDKGFFRVLIIGTDSPTLPKEYINKAFPGLNEADLVIGPSVDGGYYLIGFKEKVSPVFSPVEWGSNKVLSQTEKLIKKHNLKRRVAATKRSYRSSDLTEKTCSKNKFLHSNAITLYLLPVHYDIDTIEDTRFLKTHLQLLSRSGEDIPVNTTSIVEDML